MTDQSDTAVTASNDRLYLSAATNTPRTGCDGTGVRVTRLQLAGQEGDIEAGVTTRGVTIRDATCMQ
eukprot:5833611-Pyramimonas_sp.AAC.1